jgi:hypothetical protein
MRKLIYKFTLYTKLFLKNLIGSRLEVKYTNRISTDLLEQVFQEHGPVVVVRNFVPREKLPALLEQLHQSNPETIETDTFGYCYGINLMSASSFESYLNQEPAYENYLNQAGLHFEKWLLEKTATDPAKPLERVKYNEQKYISSTIRFLQPGHGGIKPHTELLHYELFDTCKHLATILDLSNEISMFCVLQKPESGGKLRIYNCTFRETESISYPDLRYPYVLNADYTDIDPEPGDLVLFGGGQRWHCITEIKGNKDRITIGGFICFNKAHDKIFYWS